MNEYKIHKMIEECGSKEQKERIFEHIRKHIQELNSTTACFSGHRVQKLPWHSNESDERCIAMKTALLAEIEKAIQNGYDKFLCGMALGFDTICAETVIELKRKYPNIKLIGALPCKNQDRMWNKKDKERYKMLLGQLDGIRCIHDKYTGAECMWERNRYMVNNSSLLIALYNEKSGGTKRTIDYAIQQGLKTVILKP